MLKPSNRYDTAHDTADAAPIPSDTISFTGLSLLEMVQADLDRRDEEMRRLHKEIIDSVADIRHTAAALRSALANLLGQHTYYNHGCCRPPDPNYIGGSGGRRS